MEHAMAAEEARRRLAVILAADVVGFSRLAESNESAAVAALAALRRQVVDPAVAAAGGRIFKSTGDGVLVVFSSAVEAVACAIAIQRRVELDADSAVPRLVLRIGIHVGDVVVQGDDLLGDGVNVAARIEGEAPPGGIALSQDVWRFVEGKTEIPFEDLGERRLKNIARPLRIHVARIAPDIDLESTPALALPDRPSLAVLPFENLGGEALADAALCDGLTEDLITDLSRFKSLFVIARNSSFVYRGRAQDIRRVGRELGVRYVLEGSLRWLGDRIRINAQLIDATDGHHVWADRYDGSADGMFAIQDEVVRSIAGHLVQQLEYAEIAEAKRRPPGSLKAYSLWLEGTEHHSLGTMEAHAKARALYESALGVDPGFARAHAGLAELAYLDTFVAKWGMDRRSAIETALAHAERAVALDPHDAHPNLVLGWTRMMQRHFDRARMHWDKAARLNPNDADIAMSRATALAFLGEPEKGLEIAAMARRLNPFAPDWYLSDEAVIRFIGRDPQGALAIYDAMGELYPHSILWRVAAAAHVGRADEAQSLTAIFAQRAARLWVGDPAAGPADYARWLVGGFPFRRRADADYLSAGLTAAGIFG
jgi:TolB-like protein/class 3 adenylate cyclase